AWPDARLLLLPAPLASTSSSLLHVRTGFWQGAQAFFARGGTLYLSCSADVAIPEMDDLAGCRIADRAPAGGPATLRFVEDWGPFRVGDELALPDAPPGPRHDLHLRGVRIEVSDARPVAVDGDGRPALVVAERGAGRTVTSAYPVELLSAARPDAHGPSDRSHGLYDGLLRAAGITPAAAHPDVSTGTLLGPVGGLVVCTNHGPEPLTPEILLPNDLTASVELPAYGYAVVPFDLSP
ncbi:MAG TPA: hypothetical protein VFZ96_08870, partial [Actinomycetota bacterium]|nr:hypothetical protein [Actinomycetota bacterium]